MSDAQGGSRIVLNGVSRRFRLGGGQSISAVDDVTLVVESGELVAVTGASGSGKSTLLHLVGAIERADDGAIEVDGLNLVDLSRRRSAAYRRTVGFVFQRFNLLPALTARDNVVAPLLPYRVDFDRSERAVELLDAVGLAGREDALPSRLSGGEQQRVAIARALVGRPKLLLADEPTGNLDSSTSSEVLDLLLGLRNDFGMTVVLATHDPEVALRCDRVIGLRDGRVVSDTRSEPPPEAGRHRNGVPGSSDVGGEQLGDR